MSPDGSCPRCQRILDVVSDSVRPQSVSAANLNLKKLAAQPGEEDLRTPWHFKLLVGGLILYLGWRIVDIFI